jgi:hypothetical protein
MHDDIGQHSLTMAVADYGWPVAILPAALKDDSLAASSSPPACATEYVEQPKCMPPHLVAAGSIAT